MDPFFRRWEFVASHPRSGAIFLVSGLGKLAAWHGTPRMRAARVSEVLLATRHRPRVARRRVRHGRIQGPLGCAALLVFLVPVTLVFHQFLAAPAAQQQLEMAQFLKKPLHRRGALIVFGRGAGALSIDSSQTRARRRTGRGYKGRTIRPAAWACANRPRSKKRGQLVHFWNSVSRVDASCSDDKACVRGPIGEGREHATGHQRGAARMCASCHRHHPAAPAVRERLRGRRRQPCGGFRTTRRAKDTLGEAFRSVMRRRVASRRKSGPEHGKPASGDSASVASSADVLHSRESRRDIANHTIGTCCSDEATEANRRAGFPCSGPDFLREATRLRR